MNVYCDKRKEGIMKLSEAVGKRVENLLAERNMTQYQLYKNRAFVLIFPLKVRITPYKIKIKEN